MLLFGSHQTSADGTGWARSLFPLECRGNTHTQKCDGKLIRASCCKVWNNLNPPPFYARLLFPLRADDASVPGKKKKKKAAFAPLTAFSSHGAHAGTLPLLKYPASKTFKCPKTSCLNANRPWNWISLSYTNFQPQRPTGVPVTRMLRMCVFVLLTASQGA